MPASLRSNYLPTYHNFVVDMGINLTIQNDQSNGASKKTILITPNISKSTCSRWLNGFSDPSPIWYFLAKKFSEKNQVLYYERWQ